MRKEPNTVKSNVVKGLMDFSEQDPQLELNSSFFQDELDPTVRVIEKARSSKLEQLFSKKSGKVIRETAHAITFLPESSSAPKFLSKRDVAVATKEQKDKVAKSGRRGATIVETTTSSSKKDEQPKKKLTKKRSQQVPYTAFDIEEETLPSIVGN